jgi:hypothetical protein
MKMSKTTSTIWFCTFKTFLRKIFFFFVGLKYLFTILASSFSHWPHLGTLFVIVGLVENKLATSDGRTTVARKIIDDEKLNLNKKLN